MVDLDFKQNTEEEAQKLLREFPVKPTFVIASGVAGTCTGSSRRRQAKDELLASKQSCRACQALKGDPSATDEAASAGAGTSQSEIRSGPLR